MKKTKNTRKLLIILITIAIMAVVGFNINYALNIVFDSDVELGSIEALAKDEPGGGGNYSCHTITLFERTEKINCNGVLKTILEERKWDCAGSYGTGSCSMGYLKFVDDCDGPLDSIYYNFPFFCL